MDFVTREDFSLLRRNGKQDVITTLLGDFDIIRSLQGLNITNHELYNKFYDLLLTRIEMGERLTIEVVDKLAAEARGEGLNTLQMIAVTGIPSEYKGLDIFIPNMDTFKYKNVGKGRYLLKQSTDGSGAYDLYLDRCITDNEKGMSTNVIELNPFESKKYGTGIAVELPKGYHLELMVRSGLWSKTCPIMLTNGVGLIDNDYRGEIIVQLVNVSNKYVVGPAIGQRIAQVVIKQTIVMQTEEVSELSPTTRNDGGFGSTGVN